MLDKLERKIGWIAFPSIIRYLALFQLAVLGLSFLNPTAGALLDFNWAAILSGEVWRLFTFIFSPLGSVGGGLNAIFAVFAALLMMTFSDGLEEQWGSFRTTLFFLFGMLMCLLTCIVYSVFGIGVMGADANGNVLTVADLLSPGILFDAAILFAFARYYPKYEIRLFLIIPVPMVFIAILSAVGFLMMSLGGLPIFFYICGCLLHSLLIVIPALKSSTRRGVRTVKRQQRAKQEQVFHVCEECGKKDTDDPTEIFRITADGRELCGECLRKKQ